MSIGFGIFLMAVGAILRFAISVHATGVNLHAVGDILMWAGAAAIVLGCIFWTSLGFGTRKSYFHEDVHVSDHENSDFPRTF